VALVTDGWLTEAEAVTVAVNGVNAPLVLAATGPQTVVFQTHLVMVELRDSEGNLIMNSGPTVQWQPSGVGSFVAFGDGYLDADGTEQVEVLPMRDRFWNTYTGAARQLTDDDPFVVTIASSFGSYPRTGR